MKYIRSFIFNILFYLWTGFVCIFGVPVLLFPSSVTKSLARVWAKGVQKLLEITLGIVFHFEGFDKLPKDKPIFLVSKHQSALETALYCYLIPNPVFILKRQLFQIPFFGWFLKHAGNIGVRKTRSDLSNALISAVGQAFEEKAQLIIFPEGSRTAPGEERKFRKGIGLLHEAFPDVPIYPVALNTGKVWPRRQFLKLPGVCIFKILPPIQQKLSKTEIITLLQTTIHTESKKLEAYKKD